MNYDLRELILLTEDDLVKLSSFLDISKLKDKENITYEKDRILYNVGQGKTETIFELNDETIKQIKNILDKQIKKNEKILKEDNELRKNIFYYSRRIQSDHATKNEWKLYENYCDKQREFERKYPKLETYKRLKEINSKDTIESGNKNQHDTHNSSKETKQNNMLLEFGKVNLMDNI